MGSMGLAGCKWAKEQNDDGRLEVRVYHRENDTPEKTDPEPNWGMAD